MTADLQSFALSDSSFRRLRCPCTGCQGELRRERITSHRVRLYCSDCNWSLLVDRPGCKLPRSSPEPAKRRRLTQPKPPRPCGVPGCSGQAKSRGFCLVHYERWRHAGRPSLDAFICLEAERHSQTEPAICTVPGCRNRAAHFALCHRHYQRWLKSDRSLDIATFRRQQGASA